MLRNAFRLLIALVAVFFIRQVVAMIMRAFTQEAAEAVRPQPPQQGQAGGELKKDPVCGTFVAIASSIKSNVNGQVIHFCSTACRDKYQVV
jgi:YHS domain-containing protein